uniref:Uncharacterized protein n=1 Tax=Manihot esculenta TaxID=3983 RepID=A0A2C9VGJ2_MANES
MWSSIRLPYVPLFAFMIISISFIMIYPHFHQRFISNYELSVTMPFFSSFPHSFLTPLPSHLLMQNYRQGLTGHVEERCSL